jgi:hypothetical protein
MSIKYAMTNTASQPGSNHLPTGSGRRPFSATSTNAHHYCCPAAAKPGLSLRA